MKMELTEAQLDIVYSIARIQIKDLTFILLSPLHLKEIYNHCKEENYDITENEVSKEVRKQLNQWAKVKNNPELFGNLLDSTEKNWLRHHVFSYYMKNGTNKGLWAKLEIQEALDNLHLN